MKTSQILLSLFATVCLQFLQAQNKVSYGYDAAGNQVSRTIIFPPQRSAPAPQEAELPTVYSEMLSEIRLNIYPNPTNGLLKVEILNLLENQTANILLYNISGRLITSYKDVDGFVEIDISNQSAGTYVMKIVAGEYQTEWKIIKK